MKTRTVYYVTRNNGDGSADPEFFSKKKEAEKFDEKEREDGEGFCDALGSIKLVVGKDGKPYIQQKNWDTGKNVLI